MKQKKKFSEKLKTKQKTKPTKNKKTKKKQCAVTI